MNLDEMILGAEPRRKKRLKKSLRPQDLDVAGMPVQLKVPEDPVVEPYKPRKVYTGGLAAYMKAEMNPGFLVQDGSVKTDGEV